jgi:acetate kinase
MTTTALVLNCGSSSIKYQLIDVSGRKVLAKGLVERIGEGEGGHLHHVDADGGGQPLDRDLEVPDHDTALRAVLQAFDEAGPSLADAGLAAIGHRVVHGGDRFAEPVLIDDDVEATIEDLSDLAPLHNPPNLDGIRVARAAWPDLPHVAVFDTAFHQTIPPEAYTYAIDRKTARRHHVRRYGFHGTSVAYVTRTAARRLDRDLDTFNAIVLHLGNGASVTAVRGGRSVDTSMGLTPLEGLVMGTRSGDLDPGVLFHLHRTGGLDVDELDDLLNRRSGMLGLAGAVDMREVHRMARAGDEEARLALGVYCHRIKHYVGAYVAELGRVDAIVFTAGVGENDAWVRSHALAGLKPIGIEIDQVRNSSDGGLARSISPDDAPVAVLVIPTDEELEIARQSLDLVAGS